jgi:hypothetical protein
MSSRDETQKPVTLRKILILPSLEATEAKTKGNDEGTVGFVFSSDLEVWFIHSH